MPNKKQRQNLAKLADYLDTLPRDYAHFNMTYYYAVKGEGGLFKEVKVPSEQALIHQCGTCACAVGHGPKAGIRALKTDSDWRVYCARAFGLDSMDDPFGDWEDLFGANNPDCPRKAASRIREYLSHVQSINQGD